MMASEFLDHIEWTDDCQGKKDFDGPLVSVSTRYWPQGGGFTVINRTAHGVTIEDGDMRPEIKPSAKSSMILDGSYGNEVVLATREFEADSEEQVKADVEAWVEAQYAILRRAVLSAFGGSHDAN
jgi:hypothetical protein